MKLKVNLSVLSVLFIMVASGFARTAHSQMMFNPLDPFTRKLLKSDTNVMNAQSSRNIPSGNASIRAFSFSAQEAAPEQYYFVGKWGYFGKGDGGFGCARDMEMDSQENFYIVDLAYDRVQKFTHDGAFLARWGSVLNADGMLNRPRGIAIGKSGNIYIADTVNYRIQKFSSDGAFICNWGSDGSENGQFKLPWELALDSSENVYVADYNNYRVQKFNSSGEFIMSWGSYGSGDGQFNGLMGLVVDNQGNVYVADCYNNRIQKFDTNGNFLAKWPVSVYGGLGIDNSGNVYSISYDKIHKYSPEGSLIGEWGGYGAEDGQFCSPLDVAVDNNNNIYVVDSANCRIQKLSSNGTFLAKWGSCGSGDSQFNAPESIAIDSEGNILVCDCYNNSVKKFTADGVFITKWGSDALNDGKFNSPWGIDLDNSGNVYVTDLGNDRVQKFDTNGNFITKWGSEGSEDGQFRSPFGIEVGKDGNVYVADTYNNRIQKFDTYGNFLEKWGIEGSGDGQFKLPSAVAFDNEGNIYVADSENHRIQKLTANGVFITKWGPRGLGAEFGNPVHISSGTPEFISVDESGNVFVSFIYCVTYFQEPNCYYGYPVSRIEKYTKDGQFITAWGSNGTGNGQFAYANGTVSESNGLVYVVDDLNHRVQIFSNKPPRISLKPEALDFGEMRPGERKTMTFDVINLSTENISGTVAGNEGWMEVSPTGLAGNITTVNVSVDSSLISQPEGNFTGTVNVVSSLGNGSVQIKVKKVSLEGKPVISVSSATLDFGKLKKDVSRTMAFNIKNAGSGLLSGTLVFNDDRPNEDHSWITITPESFSSNDQEITVTVINNHPRKPDGQYNGTITINSNGGTAVIDVHLLANCVLPKPNPAKTGQPVTFFGDGIVPGQTTIKIYSLSGTLLAVLPAVEPEPSFSTVELRLNENNNSEITWDGRNADGQLAGPGIYIYSYESPKEKGVGKFTVLGR